MLHARDFSPYVSLKGDARHIDFIVEGVRCAGCMAKLEKGLAELKGISSARLNLTTKRLAVDFAKELEPQAIVDRVDALGYKAHPFQPDLLAAQERTELKALLKALAVAGFGMANVMLLSVSLWFGSDVTPETKTLFHWISALIALPCGIYAAMPFFKSAWSVLKHARTNMDVPISIGVLLTLGLSLAETILDRPYAYFESALMLLFFLLIGRVLEQMMRLKARNFAVNVASLKPETVRLVQADGSTLEVELDRLQKGDVIHLLPGDQLAVDAILQDHKAILDTSLLTGESHYQEFSKGMVLNAGSLNMGPAVQLVVEKIENTFVDQAASMMEEAMSAKSKTLNLADRAARIYAPVVHLAALLTFIGWMAYGAGVHDSLVIAISVLIITCPCALGLAIPAVQVVAGGRLFAAKLVLNRGDAIERLAEVTTIAFDKTGTLTLPYLELDNANSLPKEDLELAARLAKASRHPLAAALAHTHLQASPLSGAEEVAGHGVKAMHQSEELLLGSASFVGCEALRDDLVAKYPHASLMFFRKGDMVWPLLFQQELRPDAEKTVKRLKELGYDLLILSGDQQGAVSQAGKTLGVDRAYGGLLPQEKIAMIKELEARGKKVLMVGDGLNDAPALAAAHVSLSPVTAAHIAQNAADATFLGNGLSPVAEALEVARKAKSLMRQNLGLAVIYNILAVPVAVAGFVTPMLAALAMSGSSILVTLNALRAGKGKA